MTVRVLLFAVLREAVGRAELPLDLPDGATAADAVDRLAADHPEIARHRAVLRAAVGARHAPLDTVLIDGDDLALLTPFSGG